MKKELKKIMVIVVSVIGLLIAAWLFVWMVLFPVGD
jgi:hypothetical protein